MKKLLLFFFICAFSITHCEINNEYPIFISPLSFESLQEKAYQLLINNSPEEEIKLHVYDIAAFLVSQPEYKSIGVIYMRAVCALNPVDKIMNLLLLEKNNKVPSVIIQLLEKLLILQDPLYIQNRVLAQNKVTVIITALRFQQVI